MRYIPQVGDSVAARRRVNSIDDEHLINPFRANTIVGPVVETDSFACRVVTNVNTDTETHFWLDYSDWTFQFLHKTNVEEVLS